jgi:hypothetical protein
MNQFSRRHVLLLGADQWLWTGVHALMTDEVVNLENRCITCWKFMNQNHHEGSPANGPAVHGNEAKGPDQMLEIPV